MTRALARQLNPDRMAVNNGRVTYARMGPPGFLTGVGHDPDDQEWHWDLEVRLSAQRESGRWSRRHVPQEQPAETQCAEQVERESPVDRDGPVAVAPGPRALLLEFITKLILERSPSIGPIRNLRII